MFVRRSPSPRPSPPGEGETFDRHQETLEHFGCWIFSQADRLRGDNNYIGHTNGARRIALPLPGGEGRGEGERF